LIKRQDICSVTERIDTRGEKREDAAPEITFVKLPLLCHVFHRSVLSPLNEFCNFRQCPWSRSPGSMGKPVTAIISVSLPGCLGHWLFRTSEVWVRVQLWCAKCLLDESRLCGFTMLIDTQSVVFKLCGSGVVRAAVRGARNATPPVLHSHRKSQNRGCPDSTQIKRGVLEEFLRLIVWLEACLKRSGGL